MPKNWLNITEEKFDHPATVLWRTVELRHIAKTINKYRLATPILDLGCAEGKIASAIFKSRQVVGLDNCWELLKKNRREGVYKGIVLADACCLPFKDGVFGSVFSNCVIEHIAKIENVFGEVHRVLGEEGIILFTVPSHNFGDSLFFTIVFNKLHLKYLSRWYKEKRNSLLNHFHCYDHNRWKGILKKKDLRLLEYKYYMNKQATFVWDFLAAIGFFLKLIFPFRLPLAMINKWMGRMLDKYYDMDSETGSGLLIVAQKGVRLR